MKTKQTITQASAALHEGKTISRAAWPDHITVVRRGALFRERKVLSKDPERVTERSWRPTQDDIAASDYIVHDEPKATKKAGKT